MRDSPEDSKSVAIEKRQTGQLFTHVYLDRGPPTQDNELFRRRLGGYVESKLSEYRFGLAAYIKTETGLTVGQRGPGLAYEEFFVRTPLQYVLNVITLVSRFLRERSGGYRDAGDWNDFVARVFREENLGYSLDKECGVHYLVDEEFEHNRVSLLRGL